MSVCRINSLTRQRSLAFIAVVGVLFGRCAWAQEKNWYLQWGLQQQYETNVFLREPEQEVSDQVLATFATLHWDKRYSLQRIVLDAEVTDFSYQDFSYLDYLGKNLNATWHWSITPKLTGKLGAKRQDQLNSFVDYSGEARNIRVQESQNFEAQWALSAGWQLLAGVSQQNQRNTLADFAEGDYSAQVQELGTQYQFASGNSLAWVARQQDGNYDRRSINPARLIDTGFTQDAQELRFNWKISGKSQWVGRLGYLQREHDNYALRDYQGSYYSLDYTWFSGGKLKLISSLKSDLSSFQTGPQNDSLLASLGEDYFNSSYYRSLSLSLSPQWQLTDKTRLRAGWLRDERDYQGGVLLGLPAREDRLQRVSAQADWLPLNGLLVSLNWQRQTRASNVNRAEFSNDTIGLTAALTF